MLADGRVGLAALFLALYVAFAVVSLRNDLILRYDRVIVIFRRKPYPLEWEDVERVKREYRLAFEPVYRFPLKREIRAVLPARKAPLEIYATPAVRRIVSGAHGDRRKRQGRRAGIPAASPAARRALKLPARQDEPHGIVQILDVDILRAGLELAVERPIHVFGRGDMQAGCFEETEQLVFVLAALQGDGGGNELADVFRLAHEEDFKLAIVQIHPSGVELEHAAHGGWSCPAMPKINSPACVSPSASTVTA